MGNFQYFSNLEVTFTKYSIVCLHHKLKEISRVVNLEKKVSLWLSIFANHQCVRHHVAVMNFKCDLYGKIEGLNSSRVFNGRF